MNYNNKDKDIRNKLNSLKQSIGSLADKSNNISNNINNKEIHTPKKSSISILTLISIFIITCLILFSITYFVVYTNSVKKEGEVVLPSFINSTLEDAIIKMQQIDIYPLVEFTYNQKIELKGKIIAQYPYEGVKVYKNRKVKLVISLGPSISKIESYLGKDLEEVKNLIKSLYSNSEEKLIVVGNVDYVYDSTKAGTILEQFPQGGTPIDSKVSVDFVVSKGPKLKKVEIPNLQNLYFTDAIRLMCQKDLKFIFSLTPEIGSIDGVVLSQIPIAGSLIDEDEPVTVSVSRVFIMSDSDKFEVISYDLPQYSSKALVEVDFVMPSGQKINYFSLKTYGGKISFPYLIEKNTIITISVDKTIIYKYTVI